MPISNERFATAITCIDGRVQRPVSDWVKLHVNVDHVDLVTEPGPDKVLSTGSKTLIDEVLRKAAFSVRHHFSPVVVIAGHLNCAANPVDRDEHIEQIKDGVEVVLSYRMGVRVIGLLVGEWGSIEVVWDTQSPEKVKSYL